MKDYLKQNHLSLLIVLWLVFSSFGGIGAVNGLFGTAPSNLTTYGNPSAFTDTHSPGGVTIASTTVTNFQVGSAGTRTSNFVSTSTSFCKFDNSITASSTGYGYCTSITGVTSSDNVDASFSTTTIGTKAFTNGWVITSAQASSTAGAIDLVLLNLSGSTQAPSANSRIGSTTVISASH